MLNSMTIALENEDVLLSMTDTHFYCLINVFLKFFSLEKVCILKYQSGCDFPDDEEEAFSLEMAKSNIEMIQKCISNLLNSKDYTTTIKTLLKIVRLGLPEDFSKEMTEERKLYLAAMVK